MIETNLDGKTVDVVAENVKKLRELFPEIIVEDKIDFDRLQDVLGNYIERNDESYRFNWYGKSDAFRKSQTASTGTLRPCKEESKDWDTTQNLYIEGDNLEVLKILEKSYSGKVKMIYIDPPYNKDKDFIYSDKWSDPIKEYKRITGQVNDDGTMTDTEEETEGGRHTKWLSMMYRRLRKARNLLHNEGVILISIDDDEVANLKRLCNDVFGEENYVAQLVWEKKKKGSFLSNDITNIKEYILVYAKEKKNFTGLIGEINNDAETYPCINASNKRELRTIPKGISSKYKETNFFMEKGSIISDTTMSIELHSDLIIRDGVLADDLVMEGNWRYSQEAMTEYALNNELYITRDLYLRRIVSDARYKTLKDLLPRLGDNPNATEVDINYLFETGWGSNEDADEEQRLLFGVQKVMDYPKPVKLLYKLLASYRNDDFIVLDFFSGSGTSAHAVMQLNAEDGGNRRYIMVQLPEDLDKGLETADNNSKKQIQDTINFLDSIDKSHNICEIGKERIRRAGDKIKAELQEKYDAYNQKQQQQSLLDSESDETTPINPEDLDIGFKVFKLDSSNLERWDLDVGEDFYELSKEEQNAFISEKLGIFVNNFKDGRTELDMVYEIMLKYGLPLTTPIETEKVFSKTLNEEVSLYNIGMGGLIVCLSDKLCEDIADGIIKMVEDSEPHTVRVVVKDLNFMNDAGKTNFKETLRTGIENYFAKADDKANNENQFEFITI